MKQCGGEGGALLDGDTRGQRGTATRPGSPEVAPPLLRIGTLIMETGAASDGRLLLLQARRGCALFDGELGWQIQPRCTFY
jgi:hypothetical protein